MQTHNMRHKVLLYWMPLILLGIIYMLCFWFYPYLNDDLEFREPMAAYIADGTSTSFFDGWGYSVCDRYMHDNGRLPQLVGSLMVVMPKVLMSLIMAVCMVLAVFMTAKAAGVWCRSAALTAFAALCWVVLFPWADYMFGIMFYMNYIPASAWLLFAFWLFADLRFKGVTIPFLVGLVLGSMHEIYAGTMFCGAMFVLVLFKRYRTRANIVFVVAVALGLLYLVFAPGTASRQHGATLFEGFVHPLKSAVYGILFYCNCIVFVIALSVRRWRCRMQMPKIAMLMVMSVVAWLLWRTFFTGLRVSWCMDVVSLTALVYMLGICPALTKNDARQTSSAVLFWAVAIVAISVCLPWFYRFGNDVYTVRRLQSHADAPVVFYDMIEPAETPLYILGKPNFNAWKLWSADLMNVLPSDARTFTPEKAVRVASERPAYRCGRSLVLPYDATLVGREYTVRLRVGDTWIVTSAFFIPFSTVRGDCFLFAKCYFIPLRVCRGNIEAFELKGLCE